MKITEEYRQLNVQLHKDRKDYGSMGKIYSAQVLDLCTMMKSKDVLDYGCGKSTLSQNLPFAIQEYDPAVPKFSKTPHPADIVVCTDVLEHIEPECLEEVLDDLKRVTRKVGIFTIATRPAKKFLADGRNAHLIVEQMEWWLPKIWDRFILRTMLNEDGNLRLTVENKVMAVEMKAA